MLRPEGFYEGRRGEQYFSRFGDPGADILGRCFWVKTRLWLKPDDRVFEYGVGSGRNLMQLSVAERAGYDISEHARTLSARAGVSVYNSTEAIPRRRWTVVICHHVLEHVSAPLATLSFLRELLVPGGRLILTVPLEGHRRTLIDKSRDPDHHLYCWNPTTLRNLVECADFAVHSLTRRTAAREDLFAPLASSSALFQLAVWFAGTVLRRAELTCLAVALCTDASLGGVDTPSKPYS